MILDELPCEIVTRCFSCLSTELLTDIILLDNIPDNLLEAAANNLDRLWYSKGIRRYKRVANINDYYETDFDRFSRIHKILAKKSHKCPLWFHYTWKSIPQMCQSLDEINLVYHGQKLAIHAEINHWITQNYPILLNHDLNLKVTCLSLLGKLADTCIDLNTFPNLEIFYGDRCEITVDHAHPNLKSLYLEMATFSSLPVNLITLVASSYCTIRMKEDHPKLPALRVLALERILPVDYSLLLRVLWNKDLEHFSYINEHETNMDEIFSMIGPKVRHFEFCGRFSSRIPTLLHSLCTHGGNRRNMTVFTHMTSLTLDLPQVAIDRLRFPPNLSKLSIVSAKFKDLAKVDFPPKIVDLELLDCHIKLTVGWLKPARLKKLSLAGNQLSSFKASLPCCELLCLRGNKIKDLQIKAPVLVHLNLNTNILTLIPKLPDCLQVLNFTNNKLDLSQMSELPTNLRILNLWGAGTGALQNYTFPSSIQELNLTRIDLSEMSGVKFAKGSKLKELNMSICSLTAINDRMIELPVGLKTLDLFHNPFQNIDNFTIPHTVTFLDLRCCYLSSLIVKSNIEILYLIYAGGLSSLVIPKDLELKFLDLSLNLSAKFPFDIYGVEKLKQLSIGHSSEVIDLSKMPVNFQILEYPGRCKTKGFHRYPGTDIYRRISDREKNC